MRESAHELRREQPHVTGQADQIDFCFPERGDHFSIMLFPNAALGWNQLAIEAATFSQLQPGCVSAVG